MIFFNKQFLLKRRHLFSLLFVILCCQLLFFSQPAFAQKGSVLGGVNKVIVPYPRIHESEVMWSKQIWRVLDLRDNINTTYCLPTESTPAGKSLMQALWEAVTIEETITAFEDEKDGELRTVIPVETLLKRFNYLDTITEELPESLDTHYKVVPHLFNPAEVKQFRIKEEWYFNREQSIIDVRIVALCPVLFTVKNNEPKIIPMFWIYFPEARTPLQKVEVFNKQNNLQKMNYEEVFLKRNFSSFVYKQSNVYNRKITKHLAGADGLLESERIYQEMRNADDDWNEY